MWHLRQKLRIFLFCGKFHSQNIQVFIFLTIHDLPNLPQLLDKPYYVKIPVFRFFEKVNEGHLKMLNFSYEKRPDIAVLSLNKIIAGPGTSIDIT